MTVTDDIADKIASEDSLTKAQSEGIIEAVFEDITAARKELSSALSIDQDRFDIWFLIVAVFWGRLC